MSYYIRGPEDVPGVLDLFRMSYDRARAAAERRKGRPDYQLPTSAK